jgi:hypothetical protein
VEQSSAWKYIKFLFLSKSFALRFMLPDLKPFISKLTEQTICQVLVKVPTTFIGMVTKYVTTKISRKIVVRSEESTQSTQIVRKWEILTRFNGSLANLAKRKWAGNSKKFNLAAHKKSVSEREWGWAGRSNFRGPWVRVSSILRISIFVSEWGPSLTHSRSLTPHASRLSEHWVRVSRD